MSYYPYLLFLNGCNENYIEKETFNLIESGGNKCLDKDFYLFLNLTPSKSEKYQNSEIDRKQAVEYAKDHFRKKRAKREKEVLKQMEVVYNSPDVKELKINIYNIKKSPYCVIELDGESVKTGPYYGGGYDKRSAAVGEALNSFPGLLKLLYEKKEDFTSKAMFPTNNQIFNSNIGVVGTIPEFACARGLNPLLKTLENLGFELIEENYSKNEEHYFYKKKGNN